MSRPNTRKRPAPGSTPIPQQPAIQQPVQQSNTSSLNDQQYLQWDQAPIGSGVDYGDPNAMFDPTLYNALANPSQRSLNSQPSSNQIARRPAGQQLVANTLEPYGDTGETDWMGYNDNGQPEVQPGEEWMNDEEEVERRAQIAKRDAQTKRKQIPPFIQKLKR
jgi:heat shock transcription factor